MTNQEYLVKVECYSVALILAKRMLVKGIISSDDYLKIEDKLAKKYCIKTNSIYRSKDLINSDSRGNITD